MTCREKLMKEHPECISDSFTGGCADCPSSYGYLPDPNKYCHVTDSTCRDCWDREIPEKKEENIMNPNEGAPNMIHAYVPRKTTTIEEAKQALANAARASADSGAFEKASEIIEEWKKQLDKEATNDYTPHILDSGDRTQFETGAVRDMREGKGRCDLMPLEVASRICAESTDYDMVLYYIRKFLKSNDTDYLYSAIEDFNERQYGNAYTMLLEVAKHFEDGAAKYGENNWQKGIPTKCYIDSAIRHYLKWLRGDDDEPHDRALVWNLMCCIWEVDYHKETN